MIFVLCLLLVNIISFFPLYLINTRQQPNAFAFLYEKRLRHRDLKELTFSKLEFSDPFRIHLEFSVVVLVLVSLGLPNDIVAWVSTAVLLISWVYLIYLAIMLFVFSRTPAFFSDYSLIKTGFVVFKSRAILLTLSIIVVVIALGGAAMSLNTWLIEQYQGTWFINILLLGGIIFLSLGDRKKQKLSLFDWKRSKYKDLHWRNSFSTALHIYRNFVFCQKYKPILLMSEQDFEETNAFKSLELKQKPNFVFLCIESYGARIYKDPKLAVHLEPVFESYKDKLVNADFHISSSFSTAPIYSGGSWLSYCTFMYGTKIENTSLYETMFEASGNFSVYESIFHVLHRNGYQNILSSPMGGVDDKDINWDSITRCFRSDHIVNWEKLNFNGNALPFFGLKKRFCAPDQYVINHAYEHAKEQTEGPFSVFYCTMNSHIPWISPMHVEEDWKSLNSPSKKVEISTDKFSSNHDKYIASIKYQLECVLDFAVRNQDDNLVLVVFGDHQPPLISIPRMGLETPVHVISKHKEFVEYFHEHGFKRGINLRGHKSNIKHEGFMSLLANACGKMFTPEPISFPVMPEGVHLIQPDPVDEQSSAQETADASKKNEGKS